MADQNENNDTTNNDAAIDELVNALDQIYEQENVLYEKLFDNAEDKDGDGIPDIDENSPDYKALTELGEKADAIFDQLDKLDPIEDLDCEDCETCDDDENQASGHSSDAIDFDVIGEGNFEGFDGGDFEVSELVGTDGDDKLEGKDGSDFIEGGKGNDIMSGGSGEDFFYFEGNSDNDIIKDFNVKEDYLDIMGVDVENVKSEHVDGGTKISWGENSIFLEGVNADIKDDWFYASSDDIG